MSPEEREEMSEAIAAGIAQGMAEYEEKRRTREGVREGLRRLAAQGLVCVAFTAITLMVGFYFNGVNKKSNDADERSKKVTADCSRLESEVEAKLRNFGDTLRAQQGLQLANSASLTVLRDELAVVQADLRPPPKADVVTPEESEPGAVREARELIRQKEDKEIYRQQQQQLLAPEGNR